LRAKSQKERIMETMTINNPMSAAQLNVAMYRYLGLIAADESLMEKAVKYVQKLAASKAKVDETEYVMSSPRMVEILREGDQEIAQGQGQTVELEDLWKYQSSF